MKWDPAAFNFEVSSSKVIFAPKLASLDQDVKSQEQIAEARKRDYKALVQKEMTEWQPPIDWLKKFQNEMASGPESDMQAERFKAFFSDLQTHYCNHFAALDEVFTRKIEYMQEIRAKLNETAIRVNA